MSNALIQYSYIKDYEKKGYVQVKTFEGEYVLMENPNKPFHFVRIYDYGGVWVKGESGEYDRVK